MAKKEKIVAAPVNEIDEAVKESTNFVEKHKNQILIGTCAVLVVILGYLCIQQFYLQPRNVKANDTIAQAQMFFAQGDYEKALNGDEEKAGFLSVIDNFGSTAAGNLARFYAAQCYYQTEKYQEAADMLEDFSDCGDEMVSPAAVMMLADCYLQLGSKEKAAEYFCKAAKRADNNSISPLALVKAAQVYEELDKKDKALECYEQIKTKYQQSMQYGDVDKYIERLK